MIDKKLLLNGGQRQGVIPSVAQRLKAAEKKIAEMEVEAKRGVATIEELHWMCARYRVTIMALGEHFKLSPDEMKAIVQPKFDEQLQEVQKHHEELKQQFKDNLANGKLPNFTVVENPEQKPAE